MKVLIIEDDIQLAGALADYLELNGAECDFAYNGESGLALAQQPGIDVIILDVNMPKMNGYEVCQRLRETKMMTPVLMMTAFDAIDDQLEGFRSGVDDFVVKPCSMPVIWVRLQALVRRSQPARSSDRRISIGALELDLDRQEANRDGQTLKLTPIGWRILLYLSQQSPRVVPRRELELSIWDDDIEPGNLNVQLSKLRQALDKPFDTSMLRTRVSAGLQLVAPES